MSRIIEDEPKRSNQRKFGDEEDCGVIFLHFWPVGTGQKWPRNWLDRD